MKTIPIPDDVIERVKDSSLFMPMNDCLVWTGCRDRNGYGVITFHGKQYRVPRAIWAANNGDAAELMVLHHCDNPACGNIKHLFLGDAAANSQDAAQKGRLGGPRGPCMKMRGHLNPAAKLTDIQVQEIRASKLSVRKCAAAYSVSKSLVSAIRIGKIWLPNPSLTP